MMKATYADVYLAPRYAIENREVAPQSARPNLSPSWLGDSRSRPATGCSERGTAPRFSTHL